MKKTQHQSRTPTNGCTVAIGSSMINSRKRASERIAYWAFYANVEMILPA